jgi:hypothetical protein
VTAIISFLFSRAGAYLIGGIIAAAIIGGIWKAGYNYRDRLCNVAALQADIAALQRDLNAARSAAKDAEEKNQTLESESATQQKVVREYQEIIAKNPSAACRLTDDDLARLRDIRSGRK